MKPPASQHTRTADQSQSTHSTMIGESAPMQALHAYIGKVAVTDSHVLITGETGTGKELAAQQIHQHSPRRQQPFICLNCPAIPDSLFESELFGYERGAFTGAVTRSKGAFERADGGTLFLDEIGEMHPSAQAKLLRAVEEKAIHRLGGQQCIPLNLRIIAATNQDLERLVAAGQFRPDLYFRLNVARIHLPPLRERTPDLWPLCAYYIQALNRQSERDIEGFTADVFAALLRYAWPGNVRELKHLIEAIFITVDSRVITFMDLPEPFRRRLGDAAGLPVTEREQLLAALVATQWNKSQAAQQLHWSRMTLYRKVRQYQLTVPRTRPPQRPAPHGRGQDTGDVPRSARMPSGTAMGTGGPPHLPSSGLPEALWQRMAAVIPPPRARSGTRGPSTSDASPRGSSMSCGRGRLGTPARAHALVRLVQSITTLSSG
jgi:transcriptional regulator with PAS, ATPase and Fis domain